MNRVKFLVIFCAISLCGLFTAAPSARAQYSDNDVLIDKLVEKGLLSPVEADIIRDETKDYVAKHMVDGKLITLPEWVQTLKLKGEVRVRAESSKRKGVTGRVRNEGKVRIKLGLVNRITKNITAGIGIATSSDGDPRSTNIGFSNSFERGDIRLDYAYGEYQPAPWFKMIGGQFEKEDYLWTPSDLLWDRDINPQGGSVHLEKNLGRYFTAFANAGSWVIRENSNIEEDPSLSYGQPGISFENDSWDTTASWNYYNFHHLRDQRLAHTACTNSGLTLSGTSCSGIGSLTYNYRSIGNSMELGYRKMIHEKLKRIAVFGDWIQNDFAPKNINRGWAYGIKFGDIKIKSLKDWQFRYQYSRLEKDAIPDILPDSDRYDGQTDVEGHSGTFHLGLAENVTLGFKYSYDKKIESSSENPQVLYQGDVRFQF